MIYHNVAGQLWRSSLSPFDPFFMVPILYFLLKVVLMGWWGEKALNRIFKDKFPDKQRFTFNDVGMAAVYCHIFFWVALIPLVFVYGLLTEFNDDSITSLWSFLTKLWYPLAPIFMSYLLRLPNGKTIGYLAGFVTTLPVIILDLLRFVAIEVEAWPV